MQKAIVETWDALMDNRINPLRHMDLASQHYFMQVLGWMWSMVFSLTFLSIFHFGITWAVHLLFIGGIAMTVALFKESERRSAARSDSPQLSAASRCVWTVWTTTATAWSTPRTRVARGMSSPRTPAATTASTTMATPSSTSTGACSRSATSSRRPIRSATSSPRTASRTTNPRRAVSVARWRCSSRSGRSCDGACALGCPTNPSK